MKSRIGAWACIAGVINIISTSKTIPHIVESFYLVGVGRLYVSCSSESYLEVCSASTPVDHGFMCLVWGILVLICYIGRDTALDNLSAPRCDPLLTQFPGR